MYFIPFTVHVQKQVADRSPHAQVYCFKSIFNPKHLLVFDSWGRSSSGTVRLGDWCMKTNGSAQECQISFGKPFYCVCSEVLLRSQLKEKYSELIASFQSHILMGWEEYLPAQTEAIELWKNSTLPASAAFFISRSPKTLQEKTRRPTSLLQQLMQLMLHLPVMPLCSRNWFCNRTNCLLHWVNLLKLAMEWCSSAVLKYPWLHTFGNITFIV